MTVIFGVVLSLQPQPWENNTTIIHGQSAQGQHNETSSPNSDAPPVPLGAVECRWGMLSARPPIKHPGRFLFSWAWPPLPSFSCKKPQTPHYNVGCTLRRTACPCCTQIQAPSIDCSSCCTPPSYVLFRHRVQPCLLCWDGPLSTVVCCSRPYQLVE